MIVTIDDDDDLLMAMLDDHLDDFGSTLGVESELAIELTTSVESEDVCRCPLGDDDIEVDSPPRYTRMDATIDSGAGRGNLGRDLRLASNS